MPASGRIGRASRSASDGVRSGLAYDAGQRADWTNGGVNNRPAGRKSGLRCRPAGGLDRVWLNLYGHGHGLAYDAGQRADWTLIAVFRARLAYTRLGARLASKRFSQALKSWSNHIAHLGHHTMMPAAKSTPNTACPQGL